MCPTRHSFIGVYYTFVHSTVLLVQHLFRGPVRSVVASCVRKSFTDDQLQIAYLLKECVMVRDGLAKLPDCFTVGDMSDIASYLCTC